MSWMFPFGMSRATSTEGEYGPLVIGRSQLSPEEAALHRRLRTSGGSRVQGKIHPKPKDLPPVLRVEQDEGKYAAYWAYAGLDGIAVCGDTPEEAVTNLKEAGVV